MAQQDVQNGEGEKIAPAVEIKAVLTQLVVPKADDAVKFYKAAFGAVELERSTHPKRKAEQERPFILSAQLKLGSSTFLVSDNTEDSGEPVNVVGSGAIALWLETPDIGAAVAKAVLAGAVSEGEITTGVFSDPDQPVGKVRDPFGFLWFFTSPVAKKAAAESEAPITV
ncbi:hypothetical protein PRUPE_8G190400 [Prunus persica]|uniref:Uncharacterized protein n=1 Tax=Prunus persica TaxID=3760 RepID=M5VPZ7_PRUPE|nr:uncharacterized protein At5g48480 [Prunus persica]ONH92699.1 hypothetical protein PRUPE_8G190400 [Prunus persica]